MKKQIPSIEIELTRQNAAIPIGWHEDTTTHSITATITPLFEPESRHLLGKNLKSLVDGRGADRVAAVLAECPIIVRTANLEDMRTYFTWANDPTVRANAFNSETIPFGTHEAWFTTQIASDSSILFIGESIDGNPIGQLRLDKNESNLWELHYSIDENYRGQGLGYALLTESLRILKSIAPHGPAGVIARVKSSNLASIRCLEQASFRHVASTDQKTTTLIYDILEPS
ncbi:MAG: GNAT family N-acetyltransferase [Luteolibacter sp.]